MVPMARGLGGLLLLAVAGCQTPGPYGGGYSGGYGSYPAAAPMYQGPPGGVVYPNGGQPGAYPQGSYPQGTMLGQPSGGAVPYGSLGPSSSGISSAPPAGAPSGNQNLVPDDSYFDPGSPATLGSPLTDPNSDNFKQPVTRDGQSNATPVPKVGSEVELASGETISGPELIDPSEEDPFAGEFAAPVPLQPVSFASDSKPGAAPAGSPNPFAHDATNHAWFRGLVDFDPEEQVWYVIYNPDPEEDDPFGGSITLADHPGLVRLQKNDVVLVEGQTDATQQDKRGQPKFRIQQLGRLTPKKSAAGNGASVVAN